MDASKKCFYVFHTTVLDGRGQTELFTWNMADLANFMCKKIFRVFQVCPHPIIFSSQRVKAFRMTQSSDHTILTLHVKMHPYRLFNNNNPLVSFKTFMAVWLRIPAFWDVILHHWVSGSQCLGGKYCLNSQWYPCNQFWQSVLVHLTSENDGNMPHRNIRHCSPKMQHHTQQDQYLQCCRCSCHILQTYVSWCSNNQHVNTLITFNKLCFQLVFFWVVSPHSGCRFWH